MSNFPLTVSVPTELLSLVDRLKTFDHAMTPDDLAALLNVSRLTIIRKAKKGIIPSFRVGTCVRFDPRAIAFWLKNHGAQ